MLPSTQPARFRRNTGRTVRARRYCSCVAREVRTWWKSAQGWMGNALYAILQLGKDRYWPALSAEACATTLVGCQP